MFIDSNIKIFTMHNILQFSSKFICFIILASFALFVQSCGNKEEKGVLSSLQKYDRYLLTLDADSLATIFAENGELGQEGQQSITGRETIRTYMKSFTNIKIYENRSESESIQFSGDSAVQKGKYDQRLSFHSDTVQVTGEFNAVWVKENGNDWLLRKMMTKPVTGN
jgi:outer membrane lipoprotein-sorting protein